MAEATRDNTKRKRPAQTGTMIGVRLQPDDLEALDLWIDANAKGESRPEGLRRILRLVAMRVPQARGVGEDDV